MAIRIYTNEDNNMVVFAKETGDIIDLIPRGFIRASKILEDKIRIESKIYDYSDTLLYSDIKTEDGSDAGVTINEVFTYLSILGFKKGGGGQDGAQGIRGEKGDTGDDGVQGIQGIKGDTGDDGVQGIQGIKGDTGDDGAQGIRGEKGDTGETGAQGIQGQQGVGIDYYKEDITTILTTFTVTHNLLSFDIDVKALLIETGGVKENYVLSGFRAINDTQVICFMSSEDAKEINNLTIIVQKF